MTESKSSSWSRFRGLVGYSAIPVLCVYGLVTGRVYIRPLHDWSDLSPDAAWIICYLCLGVWVSHFVLAMLSSRCQLKWDNCLTMFAAATCVNAAQVLLYLADRPFDLALLFPLIYIVPIAAVFGVGMLRERFGSKDFKAGKCAACGSPARFTLAPCGDGGMRSKCYCLPHMMAELKAVVAGHEGQFVITERQWPADSKSAQYCFYTPEGLALDSYPESDIEAARRVIGLAFGGTPEGTKAVRISGDSIKDIGKFDDSPLFTLPPESIRGTAMSIDDLIAFLNSTLAGFDKEGFRFQMTKPCSGNGIYLWHNYI